MKSVGAERETTARRHVSREKAMLCHVKHGSEEEATAFEPSTEVCVCLCDAYTQGTVICVSVALFAEPTPYAAIECLDHGSWWGTGNRNTLNRHDGRGRRAPQVRSDDEGFVNAHFHIFQKERNVPHPILLWRRQHTDVGFLYDSTRRKQSLSVGEIFQWRLFIYLIALGLCCCAQAFSSRGEQGLLFIAARRLLIAVVSLVAEHRLYGGARALGAQASSVAARGLQ